VIRAGFHLAQIRSQLQYFIKGAIGNVMALPQGVTDFLNDSARSAGVEQPKSGDDLFQTGVLDSFALVDFVTVLEEQCGIKVPDSDINPANFQTLEAIDRYVESHKG
jgi:acyl carrier protein